MKLTNTQQITHSLANFQVRELVVILALTVTLPILIHLIPVAGSVPIGARLLPLFYAPIVAALLFKPQVSIITSLIAPGINFLLTGNPGLEMVGILSFELFLFSIFILWLRDKKLVWIAAPLGYIISILTAAIIVSMFPDLIVKGSAIDFGINSIQNGGLGIAILFTINLIVLILKK